MRSKTKGCLFTVAIVVGLFIFAVVLFIYAKPGPFPPLPNPNGYDDFVKASLLAGKEPLNLSQFDREGLRQITTTNAEALRLLRMGLSRTCSVPTVAELAGNGSTNLSNFKKLAQLLAAEGMLAELDGHTNDAAKIYLEGMRFGNESSRGGFLIHRLVGVACEGICATRLAGIIPAFDCQEARQITKQLLELDAEAIPWSETADLERAYAQAQIRKRPSLSVALANWLQTPAVTASTEGINNHILAQHRLLAVELALRCYRAEVGQSPAKLADLMPKHLSRIPDDPFTRKSFLYQPSGTNWLLYSVGFDKRDDGGKPQQRPAVGGLAGTTGDLFYDSK